MKLIKTSQRTFMPEILSPGSGLSPTTDKSRIPANNVTTIQDILNGQQYRIPSGGGDWASGWGEDTFKSYREETDDYKRRERDLDNLRKMMTPHNQPNEEWKVKVPGGSKVFMSFEQAQAFRKKMMEKGVQVRWIARTKVAQIEEPSRTQIVSDALSKTFMVESINVDRGVREVGSAFCLSEGIFATCLHVVRRYNKNIEKDIDVSNISANINLIQNGKKIPAEVIAVDAAWDIAILKAEVKSDYFELDLNPEVATEILSIGSPHGFENNASFGSIGSFDRQIYGYSGAPKYMFVDSTVFSGNSGGPVVSLKTGGVVSMLTAIVTASGEYGLNAGLPSSYIEKFCIMNRIPVHKL